VGRIGEDLSSTLEKGETAYSLAALGEVLSPALIDDALKTADALEDEERRKAGKKSKKRRDRKLPGDVTVLLLVAMALFRTLPIRGVLRRVVDGIPGFARFGIAELPVSTSLAQARDRIGKSMQFLFEGLAKILAKKHRDATTWLGLVVYALDGSCFLVPDEKENDEFFGRPGSSRGGKSGFPQMRAVLLITAFTHLVIQAALGPYKTGELTLAETLLPMIAPESLVLLDRAYYAFAWLASVAARRAFFLVRVKQGKTSLKPTKTKKLGPNEWLATLASPRYLKRLRPWLPDTLEVRLVRGRVKGFPRLLLATNLLDPVKYPAEEIARLYYERWEAELAYREIKVYQAAEKAVTFRSHTPARVIQEFYGLLVAYNCVRALMAEAAQEVGCDPRRLSFTGCLERINATIPLFTFASPEHHPMILARLRIELADCRLPKKRMGRRCRREVKIKMSKWPRKRPGSRRRGARVRPCRRGARKNERSSGSSRKVARR
jgi:hypothetical protein